VQVGDNPSHLILVSIRTVRRVRCWLHAYLALLAAKAGCTNALRPAGLPSNSSIAGRLLAHDFCDAHSKQDIGRRCGNSGIEEGTCPNCSTRQPQRTELAAVHRSFRMPKEIRLPILASLDSYTCCMLIRSSTREKYVPSSFRRSVHRQLIPAAI
jgi:hypothetical protein